MRPVLKLGQPPTDLPNQWDVNKMCSQYPFNRWIAAIAFILATSWNSVQAQTACQESDPELFTVLINSIVQPYIPPLDRNGNTLLNANEIYIQKSQHYFAEYKDFEPVSISLSRFASVTENNPTALENFESKITVLGPNCEKMSLYRNKLIGDFNAEFSTILDIIETGIRTENEGLILFARNQLTPNPISFEQTVEILSNDLALNQGVINALIEEELRRQFLGDATIPLNSMAEFALLAFSARGGKLDTQIDEIFIFAPHSRKGLMNSPNTVLLTSDGNIESIPNFDHLTATSMLNRLGLEVNLITLSEVVTATGEKCSIDLAGRWMQVINGSKFRRCPFSDMVMTMIEDNTFHLTKDFKNQTVVIQRIREILKRRNAAQIS